MILPLLLAAVQLSDPAAPSAAHCGQCHAKESKSLSTSPMSLAMQTPVNSPVLRDMPDLSFREGLFLYSVRRENDRMVYSVSDGVNTLSAPIEWAFGKGVVGQTWLVQRNGDLYEATVSYYSPAKKLDLTPGHSQLSRNTIDQAFGRRIFPAEAKRCFGCHTTDAVWTNAVHPDSFTAGVQCWRCHAGSEAHAESFKKGSNGVVRMTSLRTVSNEALSAVCNQCHPAWAEIAAKGPKGVLNVRMQFYRLTNSRCYDSADRRISCTACHDPHGDLSTNTAAYDLRCQACHAPAGNKGRGAVAKIANQCPVATKECVTCHMPKVEIPGMYYPFTDHDIRIVRKGDSYPD